MYQLSAPFDNPLKQILHPAVPSTPHFLNHKKNKMRTCVTGNITVKIMVENDLERGLREEEGELQGSK